MEKPAVTSRALDESKVTKALPSDRVQFDTQMAILRGYAAAFESTNTPVSNRAVADIVNLNPSSISVCNNFFVESRLIERTPDGMVPTEWVRDYTRSFKWNAEIAGHKLAAILKHAWFFTAIKGKLGFRELKADEAIHDLADAAHALPEHRERLVLILQFLAAAGLIVFEKGSVSLVHAVDSGSKHSLPPVPLPPSEGNASPPPADPHTPPPLSAGDGMSLNMSLRVSMEQISKWGDPERIKLFFEEWSKLLSAKVAIEKMLKDDVSKQ